MNTRRLSAPVASLLLAVLLSGCGQSTEDQLAQAQALEAKQDYRASLLTLKSAASDAPDNADIRLALARLYMKLKQPSEALKEFQAAVSRGAKAPGIDLDIARAQLMTGDFQTVLNTVSLDAQRPQTERAEILQLRASALLGLKKTDLACPLFEQAHTLDATQDDALLGLATCAMLDRDAGTAREYIQAAIKQHPENPDNHIALGRLEMNQNNSEAAVTACEAALKLAPTNREPYGCMLRSLLVLKRVDEAEKTFKQLKQHYPKSPMTRFFEASIAMERNQPLQARDALQMVLKASPDNAEALYLMALAQQRLGDTGPAIEALRKLLFRTPDATPAKVLLAKIYLGNRDPQAALDVLENGLDSSTNTTQIQLAAAALGQLGRNQEAAALIEKLRAEELKRPANTALLPALMEGVRAPAGLDLGGIARQAAALMNKGQSDAALAELGRQIKLKPDAAGLYLLRGGAYGLLQRTREARADFEQALKLDSSNVKAIVNLAEMDWVDHKPADARQRIERELQRQPRNVSLLQAAIRLALRSEQLPQAADYSRRLSALRPDDIQPQLVLVRNAQLNGRIKEALEIARTFANSHPDRTDAILLLANTQMGAGEPQLAIPNYQGILKKNPNLTVVSLPLARAELMIGRLDDARATLKNLLAHEASNGEALALLAAVEARAGDFKAANGALDTLDKAYPKSRKVVELRGDLAFQQKQYDQALRYYREANAKSPDDNVTLLIVQTLFRLDRAKDAEAELAGAVRQRPDSAALRLSYADLLAGQGKKAEAVKQYETLLSKAPDSARLLNNIASLLEDSEPARALKLAEKANRLAPDNAAIADTYGWQLYRSGDRERSLKLLQMASSKLADNPAVRYHLAVVLAKLGRTADAKREIDAALKSKLPFAERGAAETLAASLKPAAK